MPPSARGRGGKRGRGHQLGTQGNTNSPPSRGAEVASWQAFARSSQSLQDEARNTELHHPWNGDSQKLRHSRVAFVAAGPAPPEKLIQTLQANEKVASVSALTCPQIRHEDHDSPLAGFGELKALRVQEYLGSTEKLPPQGIANITLNESIGVKDLAESVNEHGAMDAHTTFGQAESTREWANLRPKNAGFIIDSFGFGETVKTGLPPPIVRRSASPSGSDSGSEVIMFSGRNYKNAGLSKTDVAMKAPMTIIDVVPQPSNISSTAIRHSLGRPRIPPVKGPSKKAKPRLESTQPPVKRGNRSAKVTEEDEILADYIANMHNDGDGAGDQRATAQINRRNLGGLDGGQDQAAGPFPEVEEEQMQDNEDWDSVDIHDFDGFSTSSETMDMMPRVLAKRLRNSTSQYLVVEEGHTTDDARWLPLDMLRAPGTAEIIGLFEEEQADFERLLDGSDDSDDSLTLEAHLAHDLEEDLNAMEDEKYLEERSRARMSDGQIAKLLSKQAELGIMGDELVIFTEDVLVGESSAEGLGELLGEVAPRRSGHSLRSSTGRKKRFKNVFPSATLFADVLEQDPYDGFDVMDHERPSLRKKPKNGRRSEASPELSDSDLQQSLNATWEIDRTKKKLRRQEREELRAQGLLGRKGKPDLKAKFSEGMTIDEVKSEVKDFLRSSMESLPLPPMAHRERKMVHEIANRLSLKSKSIGNGHARFPVLHKTSRTRIFTEGMEASLDAMFTPKRFLPRTDTSGKRGTPSSRGRGGGMAAAASYRDGEIVGVGAPELGMENKGRAMLEKMGWSNGTALGAMNNKGIIQPVTQIVKTSKAGLG